GKRATEEVRPDDRGYDGTLPGGEVADAGVWGWETERVDVFADDRGSGAVRAQPGRRGICGTAAEAAGGREESARAVDQQEWGRAAEEVPGAGGALHIEEGGAGERPADVGTEESGRR